MEKLKFKTSEGQEVILNVMDMQRINEYYEVNKIADYLSENNPDWPMDKIMDLSYMTRENMREYEMTESEAIEKSLLDTNFKEKSNEINNQDLPAVTNKKRKIR